MFLGTVRGQILERKMHAIGNGFGGHQRFVLATDGFGNFGLGFGRRHGMSASGLFLHSTFCGCLFDLGLAALGSRRFAGLFKVLESCSLCHICRCVVFVVFWSMWTDEWGRRVFPSFVLAL